MIIKQTRVEFVDVPPNAMPYTYTMMLSGKDSTLMRVAHTLR